MVNKFDKNRGQLSLIIIMVLIIVGGIVAFFAFRGSIGGENVPAEFTGVYNSYSACIEEVVENALDIAGTQGGRVFVEDSEKGSSYLPFSSELNFIGIQVPYWFYLSGNGVVKENVPSRSDIEGEVERFVEENIGDCNFDKYYNEGFYIEFDDAPRASVEINDNSVEVSVRAPLESQRGEGSARRVNHEVSLSTRFGKLHEQAVGIYEMQRDGMFLENYSVDVLRNYVPVDGVEISCSPQIWKTNEVVEEFQRALEANIGALKVKGNYYNLKDKKDEYFVIDAESDFPTRFIYSKHWPTRVEVSPGGDELLVAEPVGTGAAGALGFCYVPYHFVWDARFPVMVQLGDGIDELFQFPVVVIIDNNVAREADLGEFADFFGAREEFDVCAFKEGDVQVSVFDNNLNSVKANVSYQCFDQVCNLGETESVGNDEVYDGKIPVCVNGNLIVESGGYAKEKQLFSSNSEIFAEIILEREYDVDVEVLVDGKELAGGNTVVHFNGEKGTVSAILPEQRSVKLKEGGYDIEVYVYGNSSIVIPSASRRECVEISRGGLLGVLGQTREQCFDIEIPESRIDHALLGGGKASTYLLESELELGKAKIQVQALPRPNSLDQLQKNYEFFESLNLGVSFENA